MKIYVTKWAITQGILEMEADDTVSGTARTVFVPQSRSSFAQAFHSNEWHKTKAEAVERAEEMRRAKIVSLQGQLAKIQNLVFDFGEYR